MYTHLWCMYLCGMRQERGIDVLEHDHVVWFGDLNYRLGTTQTAEMVSSGCLPGRGYISNN